MTYETYHTKQLFYKKFPYKITVARTAIHSVIKAEGALADNCRKWLLDNAVTDFKIYKTIRVIRKKELLIVGYFSKKELQSSKFYSKVSVFLKNRKEYDAFVKKHNQFITDVTLPFDDNHIEVLENNTSVVIRKALVYKKYRYVVRFKYYWHSDDDRPYEINDWIVNNFMSNDKECKWHNHRRTQKLYLIDEDDLMLVKLSLSDDIKHITEVRTIDELKV